MKMSMESNILLYQLCEKRGKLMRQGAEYGGAFFSPSTSIVDSLILMRHFLGRARDNGAQVAYRTKVLGIEKVSGG